jgi:uncharacterized protein involved in type VI secretion and phage assembly
MNEGSQRYYGKYRAVVTATEDPDSLGRIQVKMADFPQLEAAWCMPCVPYAGKKQGWFVIPEIGANVWIEFESGELHRPVWVGCFWDKDTIPDTATPSRKVFQTPTCRLVFDDLDGKAGTLEIDATTRENEQISMKFDKSGITITAKSAQVILNIDNGITLAYPQSKIEMTSSQIVSSLGEGSSITITGQDQTLKSSSLTVQASNSLSVSAGSSTSVTSGRYSLSANMITLSGAQISIG